jgi:hypothetical protein
MVNTKDPALGYPADDGRLVQRWLWYSVHTEYLVGHSSNLIVDDYASYAPGDPAALTIVGRTFMGRATADTHRNLRAVEAEDVTVIIDRPSDRGSARLSVSFRNVGSRALTAPLAVTFYQDEALTRPIVTAVVQPGAGGIAGCNWDHVPTVASGTWCALRVGEYPYWARIDSIDAVVESSEDDNVVQGVVKVFARSEFEHRAFIPVSGRN